MGSLRYSEVNLQKGEWIKHMNGNVLVVHGGGPTAVINSSLYGVIKEARESKKVDKVYSGSYGDPGGKA